jgi:hypothetical protein
MTVTGVSVIGRGRVSAHPHAKLWEGLRQVAPEVYSSSIGLNDAMRQVRRAMRTLAGRRATDTEATAQWRRLDLWLQAARRAPGGRVS